MTRLLPLALALALAGCGTASLAGSPRATASLAVAARGAEAAVQAPPGDDVKVQGTWSGRLGTRRAQVWVPFGGAVEAEAGDARFSGSVWGPRIAGTLRRESGASVTVSMSLFGSMIEGRVGGRNIQANFAQGGWLTGRVGTVRVSLSVLPQSVSGQMGPHAVWLTGAWYQPGDEWALAAALLALAGGL
ncbi:MAG: hypothetical protein VKQ33_14815 [Candidatus Sericytochromatia bacterium]|nr:hypothetical protein [Candidatus Sericytochromatia bacterium]